MFGILSAFGASIFDALSGVSSKKALAYEHSLDFTFLQGFLSLVIILPTIFWINFGIEWRYLGIIFISSVLGTLALYLDYKSLRHMEISVAAPLSNIVLVFIALGGYIFLDEDIGLSKIVGIVLIVAGAYLLEINRGKFDWFYPFREFTDSRYAHILLISLMLLAAYALLCRAVLEHVDILTFNFFITAFLFINKFILFSFRRGEPFSKTLGDFKDVWRWALAANITGVLSSYFFAAAVSQLYTAIAQSIKKLSVLFSIILSGKLFKEDYLAWKIGASAVMLAGVLLMII